MSADAAPGEADRGLAAERTALAWTRTSMAVLLNGAVLTLRDLHGHPGVFGLIAVALCVVFAVYTYAVGWGRQRVLARRPLPAVITPRREVHLLAVAVLSLIVVSVASLDF